VTVRRFNGDGISWQTTEDVTVRNCTVTECANAGLHPGTGSPRSVIEGNESHGNDRFGLFVCWRVRDGRVSHNAFHHNGVSGISTGHKDTALVFEGNRIFANGRDGVQFRPESRSNAPHRTVFRNNAIEDNGTADGGYGFSFHSPAEGVLLEANTIRNTRGGKQRAAVFVGRNAVMPELRGNRIEGHAEGSVVHEKK
jgi:hypothetical protein